MCLFVREQRMWHACPSQMIGIPGETPLQKCIPSAIEAVESLVTTALIKHGPFDEELSPQEQPHKHNEVTVHMFSPLKSCQDFCSSRFMTFLTAFKGIVHVKMKFMLQL